MAAGEARSRASPSPLPPGLVAWSVPAFWLLSIEPALGLVSTGTLLVQGQGLAQNRVGVPHVLPCIAMLVLASASWSLYSVRQSAVRWAFSWLLLIAAGALSAVPVGVAAHFAVPALEPLTAGSPILALPFTTWLLAAGLAHRRVHSWVTAAGLVLSITTAFTGELVRWMVAVAGMLVAARFAWEHRFEFVRILGSAIGATAFVGLLLVADAALPHSPLVRVATSFAVYSLLVVAAVSLVSLYSFTSRFVRALVVSLGAVAAGALGSM